MTRNAQYPIDSLLKGVRALQDSLPSEKEKSELIQTLRHTRSFLEEVEALVEAFPTVESSANLSQSLSRLDVLANHATNNAPLRRLMGLRGSQGSHAKSVSGADDAKHRAAVLARKIDDSENSDLAGLLEQSGEPIAVLAELAAELGLRTRSKERKADLIRRISTHVSNRQGYRLLRGDD